jgi:hypothetical protein
MCRLSTAKKIGRRKVVIVSMQLMHFDMANKFLLLSPGMGTPSREHFVTLMMTLIIKINLFNTLPQNFFQNTLKLPQIAINLAAKNLARSGSYDANLTGKY